MKKSILQIGLTLFAVPLLAAPAKTTSATAVSRAMENSTQTSDTDLKTSSESFAETYKKTPSTPNASSEGVSERKGQTDSTDKHSWIGSRARGKSLQTDKFPRPTESTHAASGTASGTIK